MIGTFQGVRVIAKREWAQVLWDGGNETKLVVPAYICKVRSTQHINNDLPLGLEQHPSEWSNPPINPLGQ